MIDANDKQTLPLIPEKRGRGRPKTGTAMTAAQKQKAYRERNKHNVTVNKVESLGENLELRQQLMEALEQIEVLQQRNQALAYAANEAGKEALEKLRGKKGNVTEKPARGLNYRKATEAMEDACKTLKTGDKHLTEHWTFGALRLWELVTREMSVSETQREKDQVRFREMAGVPL